MAKSSIAVSLVIAGYNEALGVENALTECYTVLEHDFKHFELIFVDDGSVDDTYALAQNFASSHKNVTIIENNINLNFGTSILRGLLTASHDIVFYNSVDLGLDPHHLCAIAEEMTDYDLLVLERTNYLTTTWRKITSKVNSIILYILFPGLVKGTPVLNYTQVFRREVVRRILPLARSPIFVWPELIFRAKILGLRVGNRPEAANIKKVSKGSFGRPHDIIWGLYDMFRFRFRKWGRTL